MKYKLIILFSTVLLALLVTPFSTLASGLEEVQVTGVVSGDTIEVRLPDGSSERVKYIGMNAPEVHRKIECFGEQAHSYNKALVSDKTVWLEFDEERRDKYGRLLAYVYLDSNRAVMVNSILIVQGFARVAIHPPNVRHADMFSELQQGARADDRGLWAECNGVEPKGEDIESKESASPPVVITCIHFDATGNDHSNENGEWVVLEANQGTNLADWSIQDKAVNRYSFPENFELEKGETVRIYTGSEDDPKNDTGCGKDPDYELYWGSDSAIWNNSGDTAYLRKSSKTVFACSYSDEEEQARCTKE